MAEAPEAARRQYRRQQQLAASAVAAARSSWRLLDQHAVDATAVRMLRRLLPAVGSAQLAAATSASTYVGDVLGEQGLDMGPVAEVQPAAFAGVASDGRNLQSLLLTPVGAAKALSAQGVPVQQAMQAGRQRLERIVATQVADAGRLATGVGVAATPGAGYVRMLNAPSCSRCIVLVDRVYRYNAGFQRHPLCDCIHVPTSEADPQWLDTSSKDYFDSLSEAEQDRIFTRAGAQAIRDGASVSQVVNARRGMQTARVYGRDLQITTEGTTVRGTFGRYEIDDTGRLRRRGEDELIRRATRGRTGRIRGIRAARAPRLMPEEIYRVADDRDHAIRLLRRNGYLPPAPPRRPGRVPYAQRVQQAATEAVALDAAPMALDRRGTGLNRPQRRALRDYESSLFTAINGQLRRNEVEPLVRRRVDRIDEVMSSSRLQRDVVVNRGISDVNRVFGDAASQSLTGAQWSEQAYVSTTTSERVAREFAAPGEQSRAVLRILAPRGTGAVRISGDDIGGQSELLLQRDLRLRVVADSGPGAQPRYLDVEVVE